MCNEMIKLRQWLFRNGIEWEDASSFVLKLKSIGIIRTVFEYKGHSVSAVHGYGTYGGYGVAGTDAGLLEIMVDGNDPEGYLTADDVIKRLEEIGEQRS